MNNGKKILELELHRSVDQVLTPWQIQEFISKLASNYYKLDLINEISNKINSNENPENFFIINESFNYNTSYSFLGKSNILDLDNPNDFIRFYHFGNPISLIPNYNIELLSLKFSLFKDLNLYLGKKQFSKINKLDFHSIVFTELNDFKKLKNLIIFPKEIDTKVKDRCLLDINDLFDKYTKDFNKLKEDFNKIEELKKLIDSNTIDSISSDETVENRFKYIESTYFKTFPTYFNRLERPIIGIYNKKLNNVTILSSSFINKSSRDENFLDIKEISHNSPTYVHFFIGLAFAIPAYTILKNICDKKFDNKILKEIDYNEENINKIDEVETISKENRETIMEIESLIYSKNLDAHTTIKNNYIKNTINDLFVDTKKKSLENISVLDFENDKLKTKIIDFESHLK